MSRKVLISFAVIAFLYFSFYQYFKPTHNIIIVPENFIGEFTIDASKKNSYGGYMSSPNYNFEHRQMIYPMSDKLVQLNYNIHLKTDGRDTSVVTPDFREITEFRAHSHEELPRVVFDCNYEVTPHRCMVGAPKKVCEFVAGSAESCGYLE